MNFNIFGSIIKNIKYGTMEVYTVCIQQIKVDMIQ